MLSLDFPPQYSPDHTGNKTLKPGEEKLYPPIGRGAQGVVVAALLTRQGAKPQRVAVKYFDFKRMCDGDFKNLSREHYMCRVLEHPQIVSFIGAFSTPTGSPTRFHMAMERMDLPLDKYFEHLAKYDGQSTERLRDHTFASLLMVQILKAVEYLNSLGVMHRDLKPANIGVNKHDFVVKLFDFGQSRRVDKGEHHTKVVGSPLYSPVELLIGKGVYNTKADIWSVAVIATEMLGVYLTNPVSSGSAFKNKQRAMIGRIVELRGMPAHKYTESFGKFFDQYPESPGKSLDTELPLKRFGPDHQQITTKNFLDLIDKMLAMEPKNRPTATECLEHPYLREFDARYEEIYKRQQCVMSERDHFLEELKRLQI